MASKTSAVRSMRGNVDVRGWPCPKVGGTKRPRVKHTDIRTHTFPPLQIAFFYPSTVTENWERLADATFGSPVRLGRISSLEAPVKSPSCLMHIRMDRAVSLKDGQVRAGASRQAVTDGIESVHRPRKAELHNKRNEASASRADRSIGISQAPGSGGYLRTDLELS